MISRRTSRASSTGSRKLPKFSTPTTMLSLSHRKARLLRKVSINSAKISLKSTQTSMKNSRSMTPSWKKLNGSAGLPRSKNAGEKSGRKKKQTAKDRRPEKKLTRQRRLKANRKKRRTRRKVRARMTSPPLRRKSSTETKRKSMPAPSYWTTANVFSPLKHRQGRINSRRRRTSTSLTS
jgi:hypothetical protein